MDTLVVVLAEDAYDGDAVAAVQVDGGPSMLATVKAINGRGQAEPFMFTGDWGPGPHVVKITFTNDLWAGTPNTDRNLYVKGVVMNGGFYGLAASLMSSGQGASVVIPGYDTPSWSPNLASLNVITVHNSNFPPPASTAGDVYLTGDYGEPDTTGTPSSTGQPGTTVINGNDASCRMNLADVSQQCWEESQVAYVAGASGKAGYLGFNAQKSTSNHWQMPYGSSVASQAPYQVFPTNGYGFYEVCGVDAVTDAGTPGPGLWGFASVYTLDRVYDFEVDLYEAVGNAGNPSITTDTAYHINIVAPNGSGQMQGLSGGGFYTPPGSPHMTLVPWKRAVLILPDYTRFFFNDVQIGPNFVTPSTMTWTRKLFLQVGLAIGGSSNTFCGPPSSGMNSAVMKIGRIWTAPQNSWPSSRLIPSTPPAPLVV